MVAHGAHNPKVAGSNPAPALFLFMAIPEITDKDFEEKVLKSGKPCVVDFWADWCHPCKMIEPSMEELYSEYKERINFYKINVDDNSETPSKFYVMSIPTILFVKNGEVVDRIIGAVPKSTIEERIKELL